jgi:hypothetical protein
MHKSMFKAVAVLALAIIGNSSHAAAPAASDSPVIPALIVRGDGGERGRDSFVVDGCMQLRTDAGLAFRVAADGGRQLCAVYDSSDGTPVFFSDGQQTLVYDVAKRRIVRLTISRANVRVDWEAGKDKPLKFDLKVDRVTDPRKLDEHNSWFRIDRFIEASRLELKRLNGAEEPALFGAQRENGNIESVQCRGNDPSWFRFTSLKMGESFYRLDLRASRISKPIPVSAIAFPDVERLGKAIAVAELDAEAQQKFILDIGRGGIWAVKIALAGGGPDLKASVERFMPGIDVDALRQSDKEFGAQYRAALAAQGIKFEAIKLQLVPEAIPDRATIHERE